MQNAHLSLLAAARPGVAPDVTVLLGTGPELDAAIDGVVAGLAGDARLVRVGNPLRSPLTVERILIQAGKEEVGLLADDAADAALQHLCQRRDGESQVVLLVEQAETLDLGTLRALSRLASPNGRPENTGTAPLRIVLAGQPSFMLMLKDPLAAMFRTAAGASLGAGPGASPTRSLFISMLRDVPKVVPAAAHPVALEAADPAEPTPGLDVAPSSFGAPAEPMQVVPVQVAPVPYAPKPRLAAMAQGVLVLVVLCALGAGAVGGLPYALRWLGLA